jgi:hypothetical protein
MGLPFSSYLMRIWIGEDVQDDVSSVPQLDRFIRLHNLDVQLRLQSPVRDMFSLMPVQVRKNTCTYFLNLRNRSPWPTRRMRFPPDRMSPAEIECGLSTSAEFSFSMISTAAFKDAQVHISNNLLDK